MRMAQFTKSLILICLLVWAIPNHIMAQRPLPPSKKPLIPVTSEVVSDEDARTIRLALQAVKKSNWRRVARYQSQASDADLKDLLFWYRLRGNDTSIDLSQAMASVPKYKDWPSLGTIRAHIERRLVKDTYINPHEIIVWFSQVGGIETGDGAFVLAKAYRDLGQISKAETVIRAEWGRQEFSRSARLATLDIFKDSLSADDHEARADYLLWERDFSEAISLKPYLSSGWRKLVDARVALGRLNRRGVDRRVNAVPAALKSHPGLKFERARWRRKRVGQRAGISLLRQIDGADVIANGRPRLWKERSLSVRQAMKSGDWQAAYDMSANSGMHTGTDFSASEWLAGWIALRYLAQPEQSIEHFNKLRAGVSSPISLARAEYWLGRAHEMLGMRPAADTHYRSAAKYFYTYYGQLAGAKIGQTGIAFTATPAINDNGVTAFNQRPLIRIMRLLGEAGEMGMVRHFSYHIDDQLTKPEDFALLAELVRELTTPDAAVRAGKAALYNHIVVPAAAYPVVDFPFIIQPDVEKSLILGLARQESEMNPYARSHAGALGLMQFLPSTARIEARRRGLPYRTSWLSDDPSYALTLGGQHLDHLIDRFDGSYIMAIAAYNAGASRVDQWIETYGDPRAGEIDAIDWVELIPFSETRNYVQRVIENTQVYRHRLTNRRVNSQTLQDINRYRP